jgi:hypothetical protein
MMAIDPMLILDAHMNYLNHVSDFVEGNADQPDTTSHTDCALGHWYYGEAAQDAALSGHTDYAQLGNLHEQFHVLTAEAVSLASSDPDAAQAKISQAYTLFGQISRDLLNIDESTQG